LAQLNKGPANSETNKQTTSAIQELEMEYPTSANTEPETAYEVKKRKKYNNKDYHNSSYKEWPGKRNEDKNYISVRVSFSGIHECEFH
jgi:hypothetical protein